MGLIEGAIGVWRRVTAFVRRRRLTREIDEELAFHLAMREADHARSGAANPPLAARRQFGNVSVVKEQVREMWTFPSFESVWQDVRYAFRSLRKSPGFTVVALLVLAIGIGANTAIYTLVDAVFLRGLPYRDAGRLVVLIGNVERANGVERRGGSYPDFLDWRAQATRVEGMAAYTQTTTTLFGADQPERIPIEAVSASYFPLLGISPAAGRLFRPDEDEVAGRDAVVILSEGLWKRRFGADSAMVGKEILFGSRAFKVIGIMPEGVRGVSDAADAWIPFVVGGGAIDNRGQRGFNALARLRADATVAQAQAELDAISKNLERQYPETNEKRAVEVSPLSVETFGQLQPVLLMLMAAVTFVLLIACTNVANLLISRSETRQREIAVRSALGAGQARLWRQLVTESCVLALLGAAAGLAVAEAAVRALVTSSPVTLPTFLRPGLNLSVLLFTMACALGCGVLLGFAPLLHARTGRLADVLKGSARGSSARSQRLRASLVVVEVALAVVLLVGAGLMMRSMQKLTAIDPGFDPAGLLTLNVSVPRVAASPGPAPAPGAPPPPQPPLLVPPSVLLDRLRAVPGVTDAALTTDIPLGPSSSAVFYVAEGDSTASAQNRPRAYVHRVSPEFFRTLRIPMRAGRAFEPSDTAPDSPAVIVSENVVKRFWPDQDPIGKRIKTGPSAPWLSIVGVVGEVRHRGLPQNPTADPDLYFPFLDRSAQSVIVRTTVPPASAASGVREAIRGAHANIVVFGVAPMPDLVASQTAPSRFAGWLLGVFAAVALTLSVVGLYGVMSYLVTQRTREFGIRFALGAGRREIISLVLRQAALLVGLGVVIGAAASLGLSRLLSQLLFEVKGTDPAAGAAIALLAAVALVACVVPAIRATRVNPVSALRSE